MFDPDQLSGKLRDEIARNFKIAQNLWQDFQAQRQRTGVDVHSTTVRDFLLPLLRQAMGYTDLAPAAPIQASNSTHHSYQIGHAALGGRLPVVLAGADQPLDQPAERFGDTNPDTGRTRRRSPYMLAQEALNATDRSLCTTSSSQPAGVPRPPAFTHMTVAATGSRAWATSTPTPCLRRAFSQLSH